MIAGDIGTGKSTLASAIVQLMYMSERIAFSTTNAKFIQSIMRHDDLETHKMIVSSKNLIIDDVGTEEVEVNSFGTNVTPLIEVLYYRYDHQLLTICTTNITPDVFDKRYGRRLADRGREMFDWITVTGNSYRNALVPLSVKNESRRA